MDSLRQGKSPSSNLGYDHFRAQAQGNGARRLTTTADNGIKTSDGVGVGMLVSKLYDVYGTPNYIRKDKDATRYWYYWEKSGYTYFTFTAKSGKIVEISLHLAD